jgi:hypothetical protein
MATKWSRWVTSPDKLSAVAVEFLEAVRNFDPGLSETKGRCGKWSARDIVSHIIIYFACPLKHLKHKIRIPVENCQVKVQEITAERVNVDLLLQEII